MPTTIPTPEPTSAPRSAAPVPQHKIDEAITVREHYGLPADVTWILAVAADPRSAAGIHEFGIPLLPYELADLQSRRWSSDLLDRVKGYGALFPDEYAGAHINLKASGVMALFTDQIDRHDAALDVLAGDDGPVEVRQVDWSLAELDAFRKAVEAESNWFDSIGVKVYTGREVQDNVAYVKFRGAEAQGAEIRDHFGDPSWLQVEWYGPLPWEGPEGDLVIEVRDANGQPLEDFWCDLESLDPNYWNEGALRPYPDEAGVCTFEQTPAVAYRVHIRPDLVEGGVADALVEFDVVVEPDTAIRRRVVIPAS